MFKGSENKRKFGYVLLFLFIFAGQPFVFELFPFTPSWQVLYVLTFPLLFLFSVQSGIKVIRKEFTTMLISWFAIWLLYAIVHQDTVYFSRCIMSLLAIITLSIIIELGSEKFCYYFIRVILCFSVLGALAFFLVFFTGFSPLFEYENLDGKTGYCFGLTCTNIYNSVVGIFRYSGFFDEPGTMGYWGTFALIFNKLLFDNRRVELILIISLIFTFSLGFYATVVAYFVFFYLKKRQLKWALPVCMIIGAIFYYFLMQNENLYRMTIGRMVYDETTGTINGNNRQDQQKLAKTYFLDNIIFGVGATNVTKLQDRGIDICDNAYTPFAKDGILGYAAIHLPFLLCLLRHRKNKEALKYLGIFGLTLFHRGIIIVNFNLAMYLLLLHLINLHFSRNHNVKRIRY